jgi:DNA polymerase-3 subunit alpha
MDCIVRPEDLCKELAERGVSHVTITDHGTLAGCYEIWKHARKNGVVPILGCECYFVDDYESNVSKIPYNYGHVVVMALNKTGWDNLKKIQLIAWEQGYLRKPRIRLSDLIEHNEGLAITTGCMNGPAGQIFCGFDKAFENKKMKSRKTAIYKRLKKLVKVFKGRMYAEIQLLDIDYQVRLNKFIKKIGKRYDIPIIVTLDCHYLEKGDSHTHDAVKCIQFRTKLNETGNKTYETKQLWLKTPKELEKTRKKLYNDFISKEELKRYIKNTNLVAELVEEYDIIPEGSPLPRFDAKTKPLKSVKNVCKSHRHYKKFMKKPEYVERYNYELSVIKQLDVLDYFLIVNDLAVEARKRNIPYNARGSVCGSLVAYLMAITWVDPIEFDLNFERFLTEDRLSLPDIDMDFSRERRQEMIDYLYEKYGEECCASICNYMQWHPKGAIKDVTRILNYDFQKMNNLTKKIPDSADWDEASNIPVVRNFLDENENVEELTANLLGLNRQMGIHASGVILTPNDISKWIPINYSTSKDNKDDKKVKCTEWDMYALEELGILKLDFLGLNTLDVVQDTINLVCKSYEVPFDDLDTLYEYTLNNLGDHEVYQMLQKGKNVGLFQLGTSDGMMELCKKMKPDNIHDIIAIISLYRTAVLRAGMHEMYVKRKNGEPYTYVHDKMGLVLDRTYGVLLFQEQVSALSVELAGFTATEADHFRKGIKLKDVNKIKKWKNKFIKGCKTKSDMTKVEAKEVWKFMEFFAGYGFNSQHATSYALLAYNTAFLKCYYPKEFMASLLTHNVTDDDKLYVYMKECKRLKIKISQPSINTSDSNFKLVKGKILYPLNAIKNVGGKALDDILRVRRTNGKFKSFTQFYQRVNKRVVNVRVVANLILGNSFRKFGTIEEVFDKFVKIRTKDNDTSHRQLYCFDCDMRYPISVTRKEYDDKGAVCPSCGDVNITVSVKKCRKKKFDRAYISDNMFGFQVKEAKLKEFIDITTKQNCRPLHNEESLKERAMLKTAFEVVNIKKHIDKNSNEMAFVDITDGDYETSLTIFSSDWIDLKARVKVGNCYIGMLQKGNRNGFVFSSYSDSYILLLTKTIKGIA